MTELWTELGHSLEMKENQKSHRARVPLCTPATHMHKFTVRKCTNILIEIELQTYNLWEVAPVSFEDSLKNYMLDILARAEISRWTAPAEQFLGRGRRNRRWSRQEFYGR